MTIISLGDSGYIVNIIPSSVQIPHVVYKYLPDIGLVATDNQSFVLNINEFGDKS